ncbi:MAG: hypothetical protein WAK35_02500, partial [Xanthobacteraceae bacterium]
AERQASTALNTIRGRRGGIRDAGSNSQGAHRATRMGTSIRLRAKWTDDARPFDGLKQIFGY